MAIFGTAFLIAIFWVGTFALCSGSAAPYIGRMSNVRVKVIEGEIVTDPGTEWWVSYRHSPPPTASYAPLSPQVVRRRSPSGLRFLDRPLAGRVTRRES
jgi:hypothetical protein